LTIKAFRKNVQAVIAEREIESEHEARKGKIDSFFANLKNKIETENKEKEMAEREEQERGLIKEKLREGIDSQPSEIENVKMRESLPSF
jgi:hypothetical protein